MSDFRMRVGSFSAHRILTARAANSAMINRESSDCSVIRTFTHLVSAVLVSARPSQRLEVSFGDSITDGDGSTMDADHNWPSDLIRRLGKTPEYSKVAVVNAGIAFARQPRAQQHTITRRLDDR